MKQTVIFVLFLIGVIPHLFGQYDTLYINGVPTLQKKTIPGITDSSPLVKDDYLFDISYGYPFVPIREAESFGINLFSNTTAFRTTRNTNHICARTEYVISDEYSVGLELTYAQMGFSYTRKYVSSTSNGTSVTTKTSDTTFTAKATKVRLLAKVGYHFNISEKFDAYGTAGFGFKSFTYSSRDNTLYSIDVVNQILPVAIRCSVGGRFFFDKNIALHVEAGIGGPIMQIGLTYKMH